MKLSHLAETLIGSEIVKLGNQIKERIRMGERIFNFTIGDFDSQVFPLPAELEEEIHKAYRERFTTYPPAEGILDLRQQLSIFLKSRLGLDYQPDEIQIASGGRPLIYAAFRALVDKGDRVIYAVPSWNNNHYVHFTEAEHVVVEAHAKDRFMPTAAALAPLLKGATLLCLCTPQNPTGTMLDREELEKICDLVIQENKTRGADEKKLFILFDQMYWTLTFGDHMHHTPVTLRPELKETTIFIDGVSKAFAATGIRVGWTLGNKEVIAKMKAILSHVGAWAPMAEQKAVARYLTQSKAIDAFMTSFKEEIRFRLESIAAGFAALKKEGFPIDLVHPQGAIYLTLKIDLKGKRKSDGELLQSQSDVTRFLLEAASLAIVPFYAFGAPADSPWYRLSVGTCRKEDIPDFLQKLRSALLTLQ
jgi:aspartate aminotransferase